MLIPVLIWASTEADPAATAPESLDTQGSEFAYADTDAPSNDNPCHLSRPLGRPLPSSCETPREGVVSGIYVGFDLGYATIRAEPADRVGIGSGVSIHLRGGLEFWDHLVLGAGFGGLLLADNKPTSEWVVSCTTVNGIETCSGPYEQNSTITAALLTAELGFQHRFRPTRGTSWSPGLSLGYQGALLDFARDVGCDGCPPPVDLPASASGFYLSPFLRVTVGRVGTYAIIVRSHWYLTGDVMQDTTFGVEFGLP